MKTPPTSVKNEHPQPQQRNSITENRRRAKKKSAIGNSTGSDTTNPQTISSKNAVKYVNKQFHQTQHADLKPYRHHIQENMFSTNNIRFIEDQTVISESEREVERKNTEATYSSFSPLLHEGLRSDSGKQKRDSK